MHLKEYQIGVLKTQILTYFRSSKTATTESLFSTSFILGSITKIKVVMTVFFPEVTFFWILEALLAPQRGSERKNKYGHRDNNNNQILINHLKLYIR